MVLTYGGSRIIYQNFLGVLEILGNILFVGGGGGGVSDQVVFIAPAYSRVRYMSPNFRPSVRPSINIYVKV